MKNIKILRLVTACVTLTYVAGSSSSSCRKAFQEAMVIATQESAGVEDKSIPEQLEEIARTLCIPLDKVRELISPNSTAETSKRTKRKLKRGSQHDAPSTPGFTPEEMQLLNQAIEENKQKISSAYNADCVGASSCDSPCARQDVSALSSHEWSLDPIRQQGQRIAALIVFIQEYTAIVVNNAPIERRCIDLALTYNRYNQKVITTLEKEETIEKILNSLKSKLLCLLEAAKAPSIQFSLQTMIKQSEDVKHYAKRIESLEATKAQYASELSTYPDVVHSMKADLLATLEEQLANLEKKEKLIDLVNAFNRDGIDMPRECLDLLSAKYVKFTQVKEGLLSSPFEVAKARMKA